MNLPMSLEDIYVLKIQQFLLVFFRVGGIFIIAPVFGHKQVPQRIKIAFAFFISLAVFPVVKVSLTGSSERWGLLLIDIAKETSIGIIIGYAASILFAAIQFGGELASRQMAIRVSGLLDPLSDEEASPVVVLQTMVAILMFFAINGHHWLIMALDRSFQLAPAGDVHLTSAIPDKLVGMTGSIFSIGIKIAAPAFVLLMVTTVILGIIARAVPQMNVLIVGLPLKIGLGLVGLTISVPVFGYLFTYFFGIIKKDVSYLLHTL